MAKAGVAYSGRLSLFDSSNDIVNDPTLADGDVKVVKADGTVANIATLPVANADDKDVVEWSLSAAEMAGSAGESVTMKWEDAAGDEWESITIDIPLTARDIDDASTLTAAQVEAECEDALADYDAAKSTDVSVNLAVSAAEAAAVSSGTIAIELDSTFSETVTSTTTSDLGAATKLWFAVKSSKRDTDAESILFMEETDGLTVVDQSTYANTTDGTITVTGSSGSWSIALKIEERATASSFLEDWIADDHDAQVKALIGGDTVSVWTGTAQISRVVVRAAA